MSGNENSKNKLLDTMRKTKEASTGKPAEETAKPEAKVDTKPAAKPATKKQAPAKKAKKETSDPFQSARRVWPD